SAWPHFCPRRSRRRCWRNRRCKNRERRRSTKASVSGLITTRERMRLLTPAVSICRWAHPRVSTMCAVRRGIDERDDYDLTGIGSPELKKLQTIELLRLALVAGLVRRYRERAPELRESGHRRKSELGQQRVSAQ